MAFITSCISMYQPELRLHHLRDDCTCRIALQLLFWIFFWSIPKSSQTFLYITWRNSGFLGNYVGSEFVRNCCCRSTAVSTGSSPFQASDCRELRASGGSEPGARAGAVDRRRTTVAATRRTTTVRQSSTDSTARQRPSRSASTLSIKITGLRDWS